MSYGAHYLGGPRDGAFDLVTNHDEPVTEIDVSGYGYRLAGQRLYAVDGRLTHFYIYICEGITNEPCWPRVWPD